MLTNSSFYYTNPTPDEINTAQSLVNQAVTLAQGAATNSATSATLAQQWATQTSSEVVSGQGYGSKKYSQDASTSATSAASSATTAASSATAAASSATSASSSASSATSSASSATSSASSASTSATNAASSATAAASSATAAATSATNAATSATNAANSYTSFHNVYYGPYASAPTTRPDSSSRVNGDLYYDTGASQLYVYTSSGWSAAYLSASTGGALLAINNLSDITSASTARSNLGLGGLATVTPGTGVATAAGNATNATGGFVTFSGTFGTPSSITLTNATGLPLSTGVTGTLGVANGGSGATTLTGVLKGNGTSAFSAATAGTDYLAPPSGTAILKANSGGALANATAGSDYLVPPSGTAILKANSGGALANATAGTDYVAPGGALGTPSSGTLTNCTGYTVGNISELGTNVGTALAIAVGSSGALVVNGGVLGTPSSGTLTNCTGYTVGNISGLASGVSTFLGTPSSANLASALTDETGSGALVFGTSPTLTTPRLAGSSSGYTSFASANSSASNYTVTFPAETMTVGFRNIPAVGTKTSSYTLTTSDVGKYVQLGTSGAITIPNSTFAEGDVVSLFNNTSGNITVTCSTTNAYIAGTDTNKTSVTLATRGVATILFISSTLCVISGNVT